MTVAQEKRGEWRENVAQALGKAREFNRPQEAEFFTAVLGILDGQAAALPQGHPYAEALEQIQSGMASGGPQVVGVSQEVMEAVRDFVNSESWAAARQVVEAQQELLFGADVEALFEANIAGALEAGEEQRVRMLQLHLAVLRECKAEGIGTAFEKLAAARRAAGAQAGPAGESPALPPDFVARCVQGLRGSAEEKRAAYDYLGSLQASDAGLQALIEAVQAALFGAQLSQLGQDLTGRYAQVWRDIVEKVTGGEQL
jgi:hypothetical protein